MIVKKKDRKMMMRAHSRRTSTDVNDFRSGYSVNISAAEVAIAQGKIEVRILGVTAVLDGNESTDVRRFVVWRIKITSEKS